MKTKNILLFLFLFFSAFNQLKGQCDWDFWPFVRENDWYKLDERKYNTFTIHFKSINDMKTLYVSGSGYGYYAIFFSTEFVCLYYIKDKKFVIVENYGKKNEKEVNPKYISNVKDAVFEFMSEYCSRYPPKKIEEIPCYPKDPLDKIIDARSPLDIEMVYVKAKEKYTPMYLVWKEEYLEDYFIGKYEVTQAQWRKVMGTEPSNFKGCDNCPVENISWNEAQEFIRKLNEQTNSNYRLPTFYEWRYAANMGSTGDYNGSNSVGDVAWYKCNSNRTHPVGLKIPSEKLGLFDLSGNVHEFLEDLYEGNKISYIGGSYYSSDYGCRVKGTDPLIYNDKTVKYTNLGFRLAHGPEYKQTSSCQKTFIDDRDGKAYKYVTIGSLDWMAENLVFKPNEGNYWKYNNNNSDFYIYGYLYDWHTASKVCPSGWYLPSNVEWNVLFRAVGGGHTLRSESGWKDRNGSNEYGFSSLPGGLLDKNGKFHDAGKAGFWWTSTQSYPGAIIRDDIGMQSYPKEKEYGVSVRCVRANPYATVISLQKSEKGTFVDPRDGRTYNWVQIDGQVWMAENLAFKPQKGKYWAYEKKNENIAKYGYLYDWQTAYSVCPQGWRLPSEKDFLRLWVYVGKDMEKLQVRSDWGHVINRGTDDYGFSAVPAGFRDIEGKFRQKGSEVLWWTSTKSFSNMPISWGESNYREFRGDFRNGFSVRCVKGDISSSKAIASMTYNKETDTGSFTDSRDNESYKWVKIGNQVWMAENLSFKPQSGRYWAYGDMNSNVSKYGYLYDWNTASQVCPTGWHLPNDDEWSELYNYIGSETGLKLKAKNNWISNGIGTDDFDFSALPSGVRCSEDFDNIGSNGNWWSSSEKDSINAWSRSLFHNSSNFFRYNLPKQWGVSVRCVKDNL